jgi:hypothetical protein
LPEVTAVKKPIPIWKVAPVLIGFPVVFWLYSLALLHRNFFTIEGIDFFLTFWIGATILYAAKILVIARVLASSGWTFEDIGYKLSTKKDGDHDGRLSRSGSLTARLCRNSPGAGCP